jgi:hypothetical protein
MVSFVPQGRMANFLFTCATVYAYCKEHGLEFSVPSQTSSDYWSPIYCRHLIHPKYRHPFHAEISINEAKHSYQYLPFEEHWRNSNILFQGYFQTEQYFYKYRDEILNDFGFDWELREGWTSIHLRLTDYKLHSDRHHNVSDEYIANAIAYMNERGFNKFIVFSDEIDEAKIRINTSVYSENVFEYSEGQTPEADMYLGSCCQNNIIAASTFSWWQAWLGRNEDKIVIAPKVWFEYNNRHLDDSEIVPERWVKL